jgi:hypothetical protein
MAFILNVARQWREENQVWNLIEETMRASAVWEDMNTGRRRLPRIYIAGGGVMLCIVLPGFNDFHSSTVLISNRIEPL